VAYAVASPQFLCSSTTNYIRVHLQAVTADPSHFLQDAILKEASSEAKAAYVDAMSRARDIELLVRSINEVASMFQDLAVLINEQSAKLDSIGACAATMERMGWGLAGSQPPSSLYHPWCAVAAQRRTWSVRSRTSRKATRT